MVDSSFQVCLYDVQSFLHFDSLTGDEMGLQAPESSTFRHGTAPITRCRIQKQRNYCQSKLVCFLRASDRLAFALVP